MTRTQAVVARPDEECPEIRAYKLLHSLFGKFSSQDLLRRELDCRTSVHEALLTIWRPEQDRRFTAKTANLLRDSVRAWERKLAGGLWPHPTEKPKRPWLPAVAEAVRIGNAIHCLLAAALAEGIDIACAQRLVRRQLKTLHPEYEQPIAMEFHRIDDVVALLASAVALRNDRKMKESWDAVGEAWRRATGKDNDEPGESSQWAWDWPPPGGGGGAGPGPRAGAKPRPEGGPQPPAPPEVAQFQNWWLVGEETFRTFLLAKLEVEMAYRALHVGNTAWPERAGKAMIFLKRARSVIAEAEARYLWKTISDEITVLELVLDRDEHTRTDRALALFADTARVETDEKYNVIRYVIHNLDEYKAWPEWMPKVKFYMVLARLWCEQVLRSTDEGVVSNCCCALRQSLEAIEKVETRIEVIESILAYLGDNVKQLSGEGRNGWDAVAAICVELLADLAPQGRHVLMAVRNFLAEVFRAGVTGRVPKLCKAIRSWQEPSEGDVTSMGLYRRMQELRQALEA